MNKEDSHGEIQFQRGQRDDNKNPDDSFDHLQISDVDSQPTSLKNNKLKKQNLKNKKIKNKHLICIINMLVGKVFYNTNALFALC